MVLTYRMKLGKQNLRYMILINHSSNRLGFPPYVFQYFRRIGIYPTFI